MTTMDRKRCGNCAFFSQRQFAPNYQGYCLVEPERVKTEGARPACRHWQLVGWHTLDNPEGEVI